jgi:hypothetical protein
MNQLAREGFDARRDRVEDLAGQSALPAEARVQSACRRVFFAKGPANYAARCGSLGQEHAPNARKTRVAEQFIASRPPGIA